ncbi:MAG: PQQ-binding-like beta-propeller repeat protein [Nitrososphaerota archaeon]
MTFAVPGRVLGISGRTLFCLHGYAPHYAEDVIDPVSGERVLVMADPHIRRSAYVYSLETGRFLWEFRVPGGAISSNPHIARSANPHIARMVTEEVRSIGAEPGDVICADLDNNFLLVDRKTRRVKWSYRPPDAKWSHDCLPLEGGDLVITDYASGFVRRIGPDGTLRWNLQLGPGVAKLSKVEGKTPSGIHRNDFGGDLLVAVNRSTYGVYEVDSGSGRITWRCPPERDERGLKNAFWTLKPHSALRMGLAELDGNLTVIGLEAGGGVVAVDRDCRPRWGWMKPLSAITDPLRGRWEIYRPTALGLFETTHVFATLDGKIGLIDWGSRYASRVLELDSIPTSNLYWLLAYRRMALEEPEFLDPPVETAEWRSVRFTAFNHGGSTLVLEFLVTPSPYVDCTDGSMWRKFLELRVDPGGSEEVELSGHAACRVSARSAGGETEYSVFVTMMV